MVTVGPDPLLDVIARELLPSRIVPLHHCFCKKSIDVPTTMCDVMKGLYDPDEVCAYRGQTVFCTTELCLSVDIWEKTTHKEERCYCTMSM